MLYFFSEAIEQSINPAGWTPTVATVIGFGEMEMFLHLQRQVRVDFYSK